MVSFSFRLNEFAEIKIKINKILKCEKTYENKFENFSLFTLYQEIPFNKLRYFR